VALWLGIMGLRLLRLGLCGPFERSLDHRAPWRGRGRAIHWRRFERFLGWSFAYPAMARFAFRTRPTATSAARSPAPPAALTFGHHPAGCVALVLSLCFARLAKLTYPCDQSQGIV
jgi:hypothetical protein